MGSKEEKACLKLIRKIVSPAQIYELQIVTASTAEWAARVTFKDGNDRRFRFTRGKLFDEALIGDARV